MTSYTTQITAWYEATQFRAPPSADLATYDDLLANNALTASQVQADIIADPYTTTYVNPVILEYQAAFGRVPDQGGLSYWVNTIASSASPSAGLALLSATFANSAEFTADYGGAIATTAANSALVAVFYQNVLHRNPDAAGLAYWTASGLDAAQLLQAFTTSAEFISDTTAPLAAFQLAELTSTEPKTGSLYQLGGGIPASATFTLTTAGDNVNPTASTLNGVAAAAATGNDAINGYVDTITAANSTLTAADQITPTGANNTLSVTYTGTNALTDATNGANISGIQTFDIRSSDSALVTLNALSVAGLGAVNSNLSTGAVTVTNLASGASAGVIGNGVLTNGAFSAGYVAGAAAATVNIMNGVTAGVVTITGGGVLATTVNSTGAANALTSLTLPGTATALTINASTSLITGGITDAGLTNITASGAATNGTVATTHMVAVDLGALTAAVTTVNASGLAAGGVYAGLDGALTSFTGGAGNNTVADTTLTATTAGEVSGGVGGVNTLVVGTQITTATVAAEYVNFQTLNVSGGYQQDASLVSGITSEILSVTGAGLANLSAAQGLAITVSTTDAGALFSFASGVTNAIGFTTGAASGTAEIDITTVTLTGVSTMSDTLLGTSANAAGADKLSFTAATALKSITLGGTADASVDLHNVGATVTTLNASGLSGTEQDGSAASLTLVDTGSSALSAGLTITGSALGKDSIDLHADTITGAGVVTITGGGGASSFTLNPAELDSTQPAYFKLVGGAGANTLFVENVATGAVTLADTAFASVSGIAKLDLNGTNDTGAISLAGGGYFSAAFANGVSISAGAAQTGDVATIINIGGAVPDKVTLTDTSTAVTAADVITLGGGADTATVTANATITTGSVTDNMGNGANTVTITEGNANSSGGFTAVFNTGTGVDAMTSGVIGSTAAHSEVNFSFGSNGLITSGSTVSTLDTITGYYVSAGSGRFSDTLTFVSAAANGAIASTAVSSFTTAQEAFSVSANGILTFTGTSTIGQTAAQLDALALGAYHSTIAALMTAHGTIAYSDGANTLVFNHHSSGVDSVVELIGVTGITQLGTAAATSHLVGIA